jgi:hypothetical protein
VDRKNPFGLYPNSEPTLREKYPADFLALKKNERSWNGNRLPQHSGLSWQIEKFMENSENQIDFIKSLLDKESFMPAISNGRVRVGIPMRIVVSLALGLGLTGTSCKSKDSNKSNSPAPQDQPVSPSSKDSAGGGDPTAKPCDYYTAEDATLMGDAKPNEGNNLGTPGSVGMCQRGGYTFGRFEKMSLASFTDIACKSPLQEVEMLPGFGEAACRYGDGSPTVTAVAVYYKGWSLQVGNNSVEKCKEVLQRIMARLPPS